MVSDSWLGANTEPESFDVVTVTVLPEAVTAKSPIDAPSRVPAQVVSPKPPETYGGLMRSARETPPMVPRTFAAGADANVNVTACVVGSSVTDGMLAIAHGALVSPS